MQIELIYKRILPFLVAASLGLLAAFGVDSRTADWRSTQVEKTVSGGTGFAACRGRDYSDNPPVTEKGPFYRNGSQKVKILRKPKPAYTREARINNTQGTVRLKVTLMSNGQVGPISVMTRLPDGLTEKALEAAWQIEFESAMENGVPKKVVVTIDYGFNIY